MKKIFYSLLMFFGILLIGFFNIHESYAQVIEDVVDEPFKDRLSPSELRLLLILIIISPIIYFATWVIVKKVLHKKHPKIMGLIISITFVLLVFFYIYWILILNYLGLLSR